MAKAEERAFQATGTTYVQKVSGNAGLTLGHCLFLGPSFPPSPAFSSFPEHLGVWRKAGGDAGRKVGGQPGEEGFRGHTQESGMYPAGRCRADEGF